MGKKGSELRSFIEKALIDGKYKQQLEWSDREKGIFILDLPRVSKYFDLNQLKILKDWYGRNDKDNDTDLKTSENYSTVKQALQMSLKKSIYFENEGRKTFRFLTDEEIEVKREKVNINRSETRNLDAAEDDVISPCSVASSGYGSLDENINDDLVQDLSHANLPNPEDWKSVTNFLYSSTGNGGAVNTLYKHSTDPEDLTDQQQKCFQRTFPSCLYNYITEIEECLLELSAPDIAKADGALPVFRSLAPGEWAIRNALIALNALNIYPIFPHIIKITKTLKTTATWRAQSLDGRGGYWECD